MIIQIAGQVCGGGKLFPPKKKNIQIIPEQNPNQSVFFSSHCKRSIWCNWLILSIWPNSSIWPIRSIWSIRHRKKGTFFEGTFAKRPPQTAKRRPERSNEVQKSPNKKSKTNLAKLARNSKKWVPLGKTLYLDTLEYNNKLYDDLFDKQSLLGKFWSNTFCHKNIDEQKADEFLFQFSTDFY